MFDGSPFGYYIQANATSNDWVIDIAGGGWCNNLQSCATRDPRLSSSRTWSPTIGSNCITIDDPVKNPAYYTYNHVYFPYCDGSSFTSFRVDPVPTNSSTGIPESHMRGKNNLFAALESLRRDHGMVAVGEMIVTGGSAVGTKNNSCNWCIQS